MVFDLFVFYAVWYLKQWIYSPSVKNLDQMPSKLRSHIIYVNHISHKLARNLFLAMVLYQQGLEKKQRLLARIVNIGTDLFAMAATCARSALLVSKNPSDQSSVELADLFCLDARGRINRHFYSLFRNNDAYAYKIARNALDGKYSWLEDGIIPQK